MEELIYTLCSMFSLLVHETKYYFAVQSQQEEGDGARCDVEC